MRQAGRYSPAYQKVRARHSLHELFHDARLIEEITLLPIEELGVDAAIIFSDILVVLDAFGHPYDYQPGPVVAPITTPFVLQDYDYPFLQTAIRNLKKRLTVPLIGFAGGPYTLSTYLGGRTDLIEPLTRAVIALLQCQIASGVDAVQLFDSWGSRLDDASFDKWVIKPLKMIQEAIAVPLIFFCKDLGARLPKVLETGVKAVSVDKALPAVRRQVGPSIALQGDIDPDLLLGEEGPLTAAVQELLNSMHGDPGFIVNLGHGIKPGSSFALVKHLVNLVKTC